MLWLRTARKERLLSIQETGVITAKVGMRYFNLLANRARKLVLPNHGEVIFVPAFASKLCRDGVGFASQVSQALIPLIFCLRCWYPNFLKPSPNNSNFKAF